MAPKFWPFNPTPISSCLHFISYPLCGPTHTLLFEILLALFGNKIPKFINLLSETGDIYFVISHSDCDQESSRADKSETKVIFEIDTLMLVYSEQVLSRPGAHHFPEINVPEHIL